MKANLIPAFRKILNPAPASLIFLVCISAILLLVNLDSIRQFTRAEIYFAETAREMLESGDFITPRFCREIFFDKPPLYYWLAALSMKLFGESEVSARLPSALAGVMTVFLTAWFARKHYGNRAGLYAGAILLTCPLFWSFSRHAMSDAWLTLSVSAALFAYFGVLRSDHTWKKSVLLGHFCLAMTLLTKGPVGIVLVGLPLLAAARFCPPNRWKRFFYPPGIVVFFVVAAPWYFAVALRHGEFFWNYFIYRENVARFLGTTYLTHETFVYYPVILLKQAFPWTLWLPVALWTLFKSRRSDPERSFITIFLCLWCATTLLFFSISRFQIDYYILTLFPALAILIGAGLSQLMNRPLCFAGKTLALFTALSLVVLAFFVWKNSVVLFPESGWRDPVLLSLITLAGTALILFSAFYRQTLLPHSIAMMVAMLMVFIDWNQFPRFSRYQPVQQFAHRIATMQDKQDLRVAVCLELAVWHPDVRFYTGIPAEGLTDIQAVQDFILTPGRAMILIYEKHLPAVFRGETPKYKIIDRGLYLKRGLPSLNYFQHPITPNATVLVEINN